MNRPTYATFRDVLLELGFRDRSEPGKYHRLEHSLPDTWVLLPPYADDDPVPLYHVAGARDLLDYRGLLSPVEFARALQERSRVG